MLGMGDSFALGERKKYLVRIRAVKVKLVLWYTGWASMDLKTGRSLVTLVAKKPKGM